MIRARWRQHASGRMYVTTTPDARPGDLAQVWACDAGWRTIRLLEVVVQQGSRWHWRWIYVGDPPSATAPESSDISDKGGAK